MLKQYGVNSNKIYQEDFLKVAVLKRSMKGATISSFVEYPVHSLLSAKSEKNEILEEFGVSKNEIYQECFLRVPALNHSTKGAKISSLRRAPCP